MTGTSTTTKSAADVDLGAYTTEALLDAIVQLTHRIHECKGSVVADECDGPCMDLRTQRALARHELIRRDERRMFLEAHKLAVVTA